MSRKSILSLILFLILTAGAGLYFIFPQTLFFLAQKAERQISGLEQKQIIVDGLTIEYLEGGKGETLVLLHGFGANKDNWTRLGKYLTPHFRVIAPDLPGFGESSKALDKNYTIMAQAVRVRSLVKALGIKSLHLGGSSMGGNITGAYAFLYPGSLKSLILIAPGGVVSSDPSEMYTLLNQGKPNPLIARTVEEYERLVNFVFTTPPFIPLPIKKVLIQEALDHQELNTHIFTQLRSPLRTPMEVLLNGSDLPGLIIWGNHDRVLHPSGANILGRVMNNAQIKRMEGVGHLPMIETPKRTADLILPFIQDLPGI